MYRFTFYQKDVEGILATYRDVLCLQLILGKGRSVPPLNRYLSTGVPELFNREPHLFTSHFYLESC